MATSALRIEEHFPNPMDVESTPALEVNASYQGVLIGTRLLSPFERRRRTGGPGGLHDDSCYVIGESAQADAPAPVEILGGRDLRLVSRWGAGFLVNVTPDMTGDVAVGGKVYRLADYLAGRGNNFTLPPDGRARIQCGTMSFQLAHTACPEALPKRWLAWRWSEQKFTLGTFLALGVLLLLCFAIPPDGVTVSQDLIGMTRVMIPVTFAPAVPEKIPDVFAPKTHQESSNAGKALAGESGKMGTPKAPVRNGAYVAKGDGRDMHLGKTAEDVKAEIANRGILGILGATQNSAFASILGSGSAVGDGQENILAGLVGSQMADGYGSGGFGGMGSGAGGGGTGLRTLGLGDQYNTLGRGYGRGHGIGGLGTRHPRPPAVMTDGVLTTKGSLDKEIIRRVVRLHMNEVKYCYDKELTRKAGLEGRLSVQFVISPIGQVLSSVVQSSTLGNVSVEQCVTGAVKRWPFPKPREGGIAIVSYPFNFVAGS